MSDKSIHPEHEKYSAREQKFADIIERIEYVRHILRMSKNKFSKEIEMKPQTYNNFIGIQGSKPNVELIHGLVNRFGVHPMWILNGQGEVFLRGSETTGLTLEPYLQEYQIESFAPSVREESFPLPKDMKTQEKLKQEYQRMEPLLKDLDTQIYRLERDQLPTLERMFHLLQRFFRHDPLATTEEMKQMLKRIHERISGK